MVKSLSSLSAISPLDGRYHRRTQELAPFVSEYALIKTRIEVELKYLLALSQFKIIRPLSTKEKKTIKKIIKEVDLEAAQKVKQIELETRHDVKAVERYLRLIFQKSFLKDLTEMIHFGLTSDDINNIAYRLMLQRASQQICLPLLKNILDSLTSLAEKYQDLPMLARTHGQPAIPTTLGKELVVFAKRLHIQTQALAKHQLTGKLTGAVGNFNAHQATLPKIDWLKLSQKFVSSLGLKPNLITTQINPYDDVSEHFQIYQRINHILLDFNQDMWRYISDNWFIQLVKKDEIGSSTMPQKVNPIDFENSEGNLGIANSIMSFFCDKLTISRLQRDLSDSTVIRNIGVALGHNLVAYKSILNGLSRIKPNKKQIEADLNQDWIILTEGVQTILRQANVDDPYSLVASLSRGGHLSEKEWKKWIENLPIADDLKQKISQLTPSTYIGLAEKLTKKTVKEIKDKL